MFQKLPKNHNILLFSSLLHFTAIAVRTSMDTPQTVTTKRSFGIHGKREKKAKN